MRPRGEVDITAGFEPAGGGSIPSEGIASLAQLAEQIPLKDKVLGSRPRGCTSRA